MEVETESPFTPTTSSPSAAANTIAAAPTAAPTAEPATAPPKKKVSDIVVTDANVAINVLAGFVTLAQQRGCYSLEESSKVWEAICMLESASKNVKTE
jgi:hypothetical protein